MEFQECDNFFTQNTLACFKTKQYGSFVTTITIIIIIIIVIAVIVVIVAFAALMVVVVAVFTVIAITRMIVFAVIVVIVFAVIIIFVFAAIIIIIIVDQSFLAAAGHTIIIRGCAPFTSEVIVSSLKVLSSVSPVEIKKHIRIPLIIITIINILMARFSPLRWPGVLEATIGG